MASDRSEAKKAIIGKSDQDPELAAAIEAGHDYQLKITQENNRHTEAMKKADLGVPRPSVWW